MPLTILPSVQYPDIINQMPSRSFIEPKEGKQFIPIEIDWSMIADASKQSIEINIGARSTGPFSQIVMLDVDNTASGAPVQFAFLDAADLTVIPAGTSALVPVFTRSLDMFVMSPMALAADVTRVRILNYRQEPIVDPPAQSVAIVSVINVPLNATASTALVAAGNDGTIDSIDLTAYSYAANAAGNTAASQISLIDGKGNTFDLTVMSVDGIPANQATTVKLTQLSGVNWRFIDGLNIAITVLNANWASGAVAISVGHHSP